MGGKVSAKSLVKVPRGKSDHPWFKIIITEGKNRQIRQMFEKINNDVLKLQRISIGCLKLGKLKRGEWQIMEPADLKKIFIPDNPEAVKEKKAKAVEKIKVARKQVWKKTGTKRNPLMKTKQDLFGD